MSLDQYHDTYVLCSPDKRAITSGFSKGIDELQYKTNRYMLPIFKITGVTSTSMTFSVACAYLKFENEESYLRFFSPFSLGLHIFLSLECRHTRLNTFNDGVG